MDIPYLVRRARLVLGQTQSKFAEQFEVDDGTVSRWERGKAPPLPGDHRPPSGDCPPLRVRGWERVDTGVPDLKVRFSNR